MSRSFKKHHIIKDKNKRMKRLANKTVRRSLNIPSGGSFKKTFNSWNICGWVFVCSDNLKHVIKITVILRGNKMIIKTDEIIDEITLSVDNSIKELYEILKSDELKNEYTDQYIKTLRKSYKKLLKVKQLIEFNK